MTSRQPDRSAPDGAPEHDRHDRLLIAAHAAGDLTGVDAATAARLIERCSECAALAVDMSAIRDATRALPAVPAPRDFRLEPAAADRLRRGGWFRRILRPLTTSRGIGRPLATAFTTLGLVGILIGSLPARLVPGLASVSDRGAPEVESGPSVAPTHPSDTQAAPGYGEPGRSGTEAGPPYGDASGALPDEIGSGGAGSGGHPTSEPKDRDDDGSTVPIAGAGGSRPPVALLGLSGAFLAVGLALFAIRRRYGRRLS